MDGNNQILPISMGITHGETGASWTWFMNRLKECIGEVPNLCIISGRHPTIILACKTVFSNSFHGYCDRHLMRNCKFKGKKISGMYWKTCKAYTTHEFDALLAVLHGYRPDESVNSLSRFVRKLPVTRLVEYFRGLLQRWNWKLRFEHSVRRITFGYPWPELEGKRFGIQQDEIKVRKSG
ncbi:transposase, MuDR, MULE transposase domain protein [Tanacetum coccineum]